MKYKIKIKEVQPALMGASQKFPDKCFMGISLSNPFFHGKHLDKMLKWVDTNFEECVVVIADHLHRFNEYTFKGVKGEAAEEDCKKMGAEIHARISTLAKSINKDKFKIYHWLHFTDTDLFRELHKNIQTQYTVNSKFKQLVDNSCQDFIQRQLSRGYHFFIPTEEAVQKSADYLLEEMAVFSLLIQQGYPVQVYPGKQLQVLKEMTNRSDLHIDSNLSRGIYIDLSIKKVR